MKPYGPDKWNSNEILSYYSYCRTQTVELTKNLKPEDFSLQGMETVSPPKWHLAHTTWFFEVFVIKEIIPDYNFYNEKYNFLFNSYYNGIGEYYQRSNRGMLSRPTTQEVLAYRKFVDQIILEYLDSDLSTDENISKKRNILDIILVGIHHEFQHQELLISDLKYSFSLNPLFPEISNNKKFSHSSKISHQELPKINFLPYKDELILIGSDRNNFCYDNELPKHKYYRPNLEISDRLVTNKEFLEFIEDDGYLRPELWLSEGWDFVQKNKIINPLYWEKISDSWYNYTIFGMDKVSPCSPVNHVSFFEAEAFARWSKCRLPTEFEWESIASKTEISKKDNLLFDGTFDEPQKANNDSSIPKQFYGDVWEWTSSSYGPYPNFKPSDGTLGEYNGKFMVNQYVLKGGSCLSEISHIRSSYRNFFPTQTRWQYTGIRLVKDI